MDTIDDEAESIDLDQTDHNNGIDRLLRSFDLNLCPRKNCDLHQKLMAGATRETEMEVLLGLDLGTTNCKVVAINERAEPIASVSAPTPVRDPDNPEYDAQALWELSTRLIGRILAQLDSRQRVAGVAVASMGESGVLVDASGNPLTQILVWHDTRTLHWADWWREGASDADTFRITGLPIDHTLSAMKLLWHREQDPQEFARARSWLCVADWITFRLTGKSATSHSMASRTMLFDLKARNWSDPLVQLASLPRDLLPQALPSGQVVGTLTVDAARATGLTAGTPVVTGGHDHICAALAAGVIAPGSVLDSAGTAEAVLVPLDTPVLDGDIATSGLSCGCHTVRNRFYLLGGIMSGAIVSWIGRLLSGGDSPSAVEAMLEEAASSAPGANGVWFVPHLGGSGPPNRDPEAWGAWLGLRLGHSRSDMIRSAMEGLSFSLRDLLEVMRAVSHTRTEELRSVGGGTRNGWLQQLKADVLGIPIESPALTDVTAQGAALLAGIGVGMFADEQDAASRAHRSGARYEVNSELQTAYDAAYRDVYKRFYPVLRTQSPFPTQMGKSRPEAG